MSIRRGRDLSAISEYAAPACPFNPNSIATIKLTHYRGPTAPEPKRTDGPS